MSKRIALFPALLLALLVIVATALTWMNFSQALPRSQWAQAAWSPDIDVIEQMIFHYSLAASGDFAAGGRRPGAGGRAVSASAA